jgi:iron complex outermembrane receptor protein
MFFKKNALTVSLFAAICGATHAAEQQTGIQKLNYRSAHPLVQSAGLCGC